MVAAATRDETPRRTRRCRRVTVCNARCEVQRANELRSRATAPTRSAGASRCRGGTPWESRFATDHRALAYSTANARLRSSASMRTAPEMQPMRNRAKTYRHPGPGPWPRERDLSVDFDVLRSAEAPTRRSRSSMPAASRWWRSQSLNRKVEAPAAESAELRQENRALRARIEQLVRRPRPAP